MRIRLRVNADCEVDSTGSRGQHGHPRGWGTCENCRFETRVDDSPSFSGDRIYVMKKAWLSPLSRRRARSGPRGGRSPSSSCPRSPRSATSSGWSACRGRRSGSRRETSGASAPRTIRTRTPFQRLRRPLGHQQAMQVLVYDDSHRASLAARRPALAAVAAPGDGLAEPSPGTFRRPRGSRTGPNCVTGTSSPTPSSGRRSARAGRSRPSRADADHRFLLVQHRPSAPAASASVRDAALAPAALGGRPDALCRLKVNEPAGQSGSS